METRGFKVSDIQAVAQLIGSDESFMEGEDAVWKDSFLEAKVLKASASDCLHVKVLHGGADAYYCIGSVGSSAQCHA